MKTIGKAILGGTLTAVIAAAISLSLMIGHFGSCGPTNIPSRIGLYLQYPGWWIMERLEYFCWFFAKHNLEMPLVLFLQSIFWSCAWFVVVKQMTVKK